MKSKRKTVIRRVSALVDADPTFLSVVNAGASGSPFNMVKHEDSPMKMKPRNTATTKKTAKKPAPTKVVKNANNKVEGKVVAPTVSEERVILAFQYDKEAFADEAAVREHLEKSDFENDYTITEEDDHFLVTNSDAVSTTVSKKAEVEADDNVIAIVGVLGKAEEAEEEEDGDEDENEDEDEESEEDESESEDTPVLSKKAQYLADLKKAADAKNEEPVEAVLQKFDFYEVYESGSSDFITLLKEGCDDGSAPSFDDVLWTFGKSIKNALKDDSADAISTKITQNAADFTAVALQMHTLFANILNADMEVLKKSDAKQAEGFQKWAEDFGNHLIADTEAKTTTTKGEKTVVVKNENVGVGEGRIVELLNAALTPALEKITTLSKTVDTIKTRRQTSKSAGSADATTTEDDKKSSKSYKKGDEQGEDTPAKQAAQRLAKTVFAS